MSQNRFWNLLAKKMSGEAMPDEVVELEQLIKDNPDWVYAAEHIESIWKLQPREETYDTELSFAMHVAHQPLSGLDTSQLDTPLLPHALTDIPTSHKISHLRSYIAAFVVLLAVAGLFWKFSSPRTETEMRKRISEVSTGMANKTRLVLPDSSVVWLNAGSKLTYNEQFGITNRHTTLSGEAYFEVKKSKVPFIIHASSVEIKVMGTVFNVKSYPNEKTTETTLITGRVEVSLDKRPGQKFILKPNEKLVVSNEMEDKESKVAEKKQEPLVVLSNLTQAEDHSIIETSWKDNKLVFRDESFEEMARKMERWYDVTIEIPDPKIAQMRVTGTFENETIRQALDALQIAFKFNYSIHQNKITITQ